MAKAADRELEQKEMVRSLLLEENTFTLATLGDDGRPYICPLFYVADDDLQIYWVSSADSLHSLHLGVRDKVSASVYHATSRWQEIRGLQMLGSARPVEDSAVNKQVRNLYAERFHLGQILRLALLKSSLYEFHPEWIRYIDNRRHFGFKFELKFPAAAV